MSSTLTKKEKGFANDFIQTGNGVESAMNNYDVSTYNSAGAIASQNLKKLKIQEYIANHAEDAEAMIYKLSQSAKAEFVRLGASKDIMDRAGFKPTEKVETKNTNINVNIDSKSLEIAKKYEEEIKQGL